MERNYLTTRQLAKVAGVSLNTIYRWLNAEKIDEPIRDPRNNYRLWTDKNVEQVRYRVLSLAGNLKKERYSGRS